MRFIALFGAGLAICGCSIPDVGPELGAFSGAVNDVAQDYRRELNITDGTARDGLVDALVANRRALVSLSDGCEELGDNFSRGSLSDCNLDFGDISPLELTPAEAQSILLSIENYFEALSGLANATNEADIENATGGLIDALGKLSAAAGTEQRGLTNFVGELQEDREGLVGVAGLVARGMQIRTLRRVVEDAEGPMRRLVQALIDTAVASGAQTSNAAKKTLTDAQDALEDAQFGGSDAEYRAALRSFLIAYDRFIEHQKTALVPRLYSIAATHSALNARLQRGASLDEVVTFLEELKELNEALEG